MTEHQTRRRRFRKVGGVMAVVLGVLLIALERSEALGGAQQGVAWFWIVIGGLLVLVGLAELADRS
jgi:hypothetical protein